MSTAAGHEVRGLRGEDLDPEIRAFVRRMSEGWARYPGFAGAAPSEARRIAEIVREPWTRGGPEMRAVTEHEIPAGTGPVRVRCYDPGPPGLKPGLVYLHGGGWTIFSLDTHDRLMRELAARAGAVVVGVDYALSPEAKFPLALTQASAAVRYVMTRGRDFGVDPTRVAIAGDSAGGNLSLATCLRLRDAGDAALPAGMALLYGAFARTCSADAVARFGGEGYMLAGDEMDQFWKNYLNDESEAEDPYACPVLADLRGLPPALLVVPSCDVLTEQSLRLAGLLENAGVKTRCNVYDGATHSFLEAVSVSKLADRALAETATWLRDVLGQNAPAPRT